MWFAIREWICIITWCWRLGALAVGDSRGFWFMFGRRGLAGCHVLAVNWNFLDFGLVRFMGSHSVLGFGWMEVKGQVGGGGAL